MMIDAHLIYANVSSVFATLGSLLARMKKVRGGSDFVSGFFRVVRKLVKPPKILRIFKICAPTSSSFMDIVCRLSLFIFTN